MREMHEMPRDVHLTYQCQVSSTLIATGADESVYGTERCNAHGQREEETEKEEDKGPQSTPALSVAGDTGVARDRVVAKDRGEDAAGGNTKHR